jgi:DNA-binding IscR family transcriptional regulator
MSLNSRGVKIEDGRGLIVGMVLTNEIAGRPVGQNGQLVFHCYRDRCLLSEVWSSARENGRQFLTQRAEAELAKEEQGKYFAILGEKPEKSRN